jgi:hypothetical protein
MDFDPILAPADMCSEGKISLSTWRRQYRNSLPIVQISPKRIGVRRSDWLAALARRTAQGGALPGAQE